MHVIGDFLGFFVFGEGAQRISNTIGLLVKIVRIKNSIDLKFHHSKTLHCFKISSLGICLSLCQSADRRACFDMSGGWRIRLRGIRD